MKISMRAALSQIQQADQDLLQAAPSPFPIPAKGLEAVIAGGFMGIDRTDWVVPGLRERIGAVLRGCPQARLVDGQAGCRPWRVAPVTTSPAARMLHACGLAMATPDEAVLCFLGEGSASCGAFHEALNFAALHHLRVIFLAHAWQRSPGAPYAEQLAGSLSHHAMAYGIKGRRIDGGLISEVLSAVSEARASGGPRLIEAHLTPGEDPLARARDELTETDPSGEVQLSVG
jgi:pyruvate dehydrogenase E1 component alpha subunit